MNGLQLRPVRGISRELADEILAVQYLDAVRAEDLPSGLDYAVADYSVNSGPAKAVRDLQRELGVSADGVIGVQTLAAVSQADIPDLIVRLCRRRMRFLHSLKTWGTFGGGWGRRVMGNQDGGAVARHRCCGSSGTSVA
ncbi:putative peptidoglycan-binding domain-containing protein [Leisingera sp. M658]|uniref:putative peptidoglycan-binding domain-containing protein n=1 Tax=Leisingera sp. M658 TaxID=2867015 RepID=UPI0038FD0E3E